MAVYYVAVNAEGTEFMHPHDLKMHGANQGEIVEGAFAKLLANVMITRWGGARLVADCDDDVIEATRGRNITAEAAKQYNEHNRPKDAPPIELASPRWAKS